ncbi:MAG: hypothetical protein UT01_C0062G0001 [Candidatus Daviesbacteria bacterium GW2011_GWA1_38_7]|nr:MAG: hypothetical protein UT01_C0062G0001 [Candidatus Daviesbacteria bacterium GW2011_GWA1_38_7]
MNYGFSERRNKRREKRKENRKYPYKKGGARRSGNIDIKKR